jgi:lipooligosaccharide transport system ATP-binding protein
VRDGLAIRLRGVVKRYGPITAVNGLDLDVPEGTCVGLLGPNGAGKSTTMRLLTAQAIADEGELEVLGFRLPEESKAARAECGVAPQLDNLDVTLTVEQNLLVFTHLYRIGRAERRGAIEAALEMANLGDRRDTRVDKLSGGMRRRLLIARALVHRPRLVLLDDRPSASIRRCGKSSGRSSTRSARRGRRFSCRRTTSRKPSASRIPS